MLTTRLTSSTRCGRFSFQQRSDILLRTRASLEKYSFEGEIVGALSRTNIKSMRRGLLAELQSYEVMA